MTNDDLDELWQAKIAAAEKSMTERVSNALYAGPPSRRLTAEQIARQPGYYWTRYAGQDWTLDYWGHDCWSFHGSDEISHDDPTEIVGPVEPPPR